MEDPVTIGELRAIVGDRPFFISYETYGGLVATEEAYPVQLVGTSFVDLNTGIEEHIEEGESLPPHFILLDWIEPERIVYRSICVCTHSLLKGGCTCGHVTPYEVK